MGSGASLDVSSQKVTSASASSEFNTSTVYTNGHVSAGDAPSAVPRRSTTTICGSNPSLSTPLKMSCETCSVHFTLFKRKKCCQGCCRFFCSNCMPKPTSPNMARQCVKCQLLLSGRFSRETLQGWKIKDMRCFLHNRNISTSQCREKHDLIELLLTQFCTRPRPSIQNQAQHQYLVRQMAEHVRDISSNPQPNSSTTQNESNTNDRISGDSATVPGSDNIPNSQMSNSTTSGSLSEGDSSENNEDRLQNLLERLQDMLTGPLGESGEENKDLESAGQAIRRTQLDDIVQVSDIEGLTIRQLKELLVNNFVDYRGCCEKAELIERVGRLWADHQLNKQRAEELHKGDEAAEELHKGDEAGAPSTPHVGEDHIAPTVDTDPAEQTSEDNCQDTGTTMTTAAMAEDTSSHPSTTDEDPLLKDATTTADPQSTSSSLPTTLSNSVNGGRRDDLCHVCMDSLVDCILLECGHMVTCAPCGKRLADCPICRQYIVRVVRVFRS